MRLTLADEISMAMMMLIGARVVLRSLSFQTPGGRIELEYGVSLPPFSK